MALVLRLHGIPAAGRRRLHGGHADPSRHYKVDRPRRPRVGRGVLPELRLDPVRAHPDPVAATAGIDPTSAACEVATLRDGRTPRQFGTQSQPAERRGRPDVGPNGLPHRERATVNSGGAAAVRTARPHGRSFLLWLVTAAAILIGALAALKLAAVRWRYLRRGPRGQASAAYHELSTYIGDQGVRVPANATFEELAGLVEQPGAWTPPAWPTAGSAARYAPPGDRRPRRAATCGRSCAGSAATSPQPRPCASAAHGRAAAALGAGSDHASRLIRIWRAAAVARAAIVRSRMYHDDTYELFQRGRAHLQRGDNAQATVSLEKAKRREPDKASIREALGLAYLRLHRYREAAAEFEHILDTAPANDYAHYCMGRCLSRMGEERPGRRPLQDGAVAAARGRLLPRSGRPSSSGCLPSRVEPDRDRARRSRARPACARRSGRSAPPAPSQPQLVGHRVDQPPPLLRRRGGGEPRPVAARDVGVERELRHAQHAAGRRRSPSGSCGPASSPKTRSRAILSASRRRPGRCRRVPPRPAPAGRGRSRRSRSPPPRPRPPTPAAAALAWPSDSPRPEESPCYPSGTVSGNWGVRRGG